ncbi:phospholipase D alpha 1-like [Hibiscus syriacus]|uniref:phospholipase D alpha 1-like n=1 Tax=Hibiscus syriacus TaxID=106335 RepID=UPI001922C62C|nr:phospholipase D alpha 1-like [Hibiscus syriacus]
MAGSIETEIAMGAFQPHHLATTQPARGQTFGLRMALWRDSFMALSLFQKPRTVSVNSNPLLKETRICTRVTIEEDPLGHLTRYPINVGEDGSVSLLPGTETSPGTKASVLGSKSNILPPIVTTFLIAVLKLFFLEK